ncbi:MAG: phosphodiesterase [Anaerofustis stercorihominis]|nr:phosphodiesterase [Anaerofustis stercorihominis]
MKLLIASDIHGSIRYAKKIIEVFDRGGFDGIVLLGDILYHGPRNDLPEEYAPKEVAALFNEYADKIICMRGNCDAYVDSMVLDFALCDDIGVIFDGNNKIYMSHGHIYNPDNLPKIPEGSIFLYGHTHVAKDEVINGIRAINPGSISIPKNGQKNSYLIYDNGLFIWYDTDDIELTY